MTVPVREGPLVGAAVTATTPGPDPVDVPTDNHGALLAAVHGHPALAATVTAWDPPDGPGANVIGEIVYEQPSDSVTLKC